MLGELEAKTVLAAYGIPVVATVATATTGDAAVAAANGLGYPVALKILSPDISHKSDVGGVRLNIADEAALRTEMQSGKTIADVAKAIAAERTDHHEEP